MNNTVSECCFVHICVYDGYRCWTQGKDEKLEYLYKSKLWYVTPQCSALNSLTIDDSPNRQGKTKSTFSKSTFVIPSNVSAPEGETYEFIVSQLAGIGISTVDMTKSSNEKHESSNSFSGLESFVQRTKVIDTVWRNLAARCCQLMPQSP